MSEIEDNLREDDFVVALDGVMSFEAEKMCKKLKMAGVEFSLERSSSKESGTINPRSDNAAAAITHIANAFSSGGLTTCYRLVVRRDDIIKARDVLGIVDGDSSDSSMPTQELPPPTSTEFNATSESGHPTLNLFWRLILWGVATLFVLKIVHEITS